jgi:hypothetical protein
MYSSHISIDNFIGNMLVATIPFSTPSLKPPTEKPNEKYYKAIWGKTTSDHPITTIAAAATAIATSVVPLSLL